MYLQDELIEGLRRNDQKIIRWLYQAEFPKVANYLERNNGSLEEAQDIYQEAFVVLWKKIKTGEFHPENSTAVSGFLFQIAKFKWMAELRKQQRHRSVPLGETPDLPSEIFPVDATQEDNAKLLEEAYQQLGGNCREILRRFYFQKENMADIASHFSWTEATARNNKYRCIQRLKEKMGLKAKTNNKIDTRE